MEYFSSEIIDLLNKLNNISLDNYTIISEEIKKPQETSGTSSSEGKSTSSLSQQNQKEGGDQTQSEDNSQSNSEKQIVITNMERNSTLKNDTENIDWDFIKSEIELMNSSWSVLMLELYKANIPNDTINSFGDFLDKAILSIKNEDKISSLNNLTSLYSYIPQFLNTASPEKYRYNLENTKYNVLVAYSLVTQGDWNTSLAKLLEAETSFLTLFNDAEYIKNKEFKVNKTYMLIKDLQNSIIYTDKQLFFLKYKSIIEILKTL